MSKGDKSRITDKKAFDEGFDRIFKEKKNPKEPYINEYGDIKTENINEYGDIIRLDKNIKVCQYLSIEQTRRSQWLKKTE